MELKPLSPTNDFVFKKIFSEHIAILEDFLNAVLDLSPDEYKRLTVVDPNLDREYFDDKLGILDIKVHTASGRVIDIELQVRPQPSIWKRVIFYTAKMLTEQLKSGGRFDHINRVITILIADFVMLREIGAYHNRFRLYDEKTGARFPDSIEINTLELPKVKETDGTALGDWMRFFQARTKEEFMRAAETNPAIKEACGVITFLSGDERTRAIADLREKARMDYESGLSDARQEGLQEGRQEGRQDVARNLLRKKMSYDDISDATGLSLDEIKRLDAELGR